MTSTSSSCTLTNSNPFYAHYQSSARSSSSSHYYKSNFNHYSCYSIYIRVEQNLLILFICGLAFFLVFLLISLLLNLFLVRCIRRIRMMHVGRLCCGRLLRLSSQWECLGCFLGLGGCSGERSMCLWKKSRWKLQISMCLAMILLNLLETPIFR